MRESKKYLGFMVQLSNIRRPCKSPYGKSMWVFSCNPLLPMWITTNVF